MEVIEITYRYDATDATLRPRPADALAARDRLDQGSRTIAAHTIQRAIGTDDPRGLRAAYGVYLLAERQVWAPRAGSADCAGLAFPPADAAAFDAFADAAVRSRRIATMLEAP